MTIERLTRASGMPRDGHENRYRLAATLIEPTDRVIDAACGTGYGSELIGSCQYLGVDLTLDHLEVEPTDTRRFVAADLQTWEPPEPFDVFITFETIEHLADYSHFIDVAHRANELIIASVPVVPTVGANPYHCHDFAPGDLAALLAADGWEIGFTMDQPDELSEIVVARRTK